MIEPLRKELIKRGWTEKVIEDSLEIPNLIWLSRSNAVVIEGSPLVNRLSQIPLKNFCYKDILIDYGRRVKCNPSKKTKLNMPRTFKLFADEKNEFMEDYRLTAYSSLIRFVKATGSKAFSDTGKINSSWINFAIEKLELALVSDKSDRPDIKGESYMEKLWKNENVFSKFKKVYQSVVKYHSKIKANSTAKTTLLHQCDVIYAKCASVWKDFEKDGFYNLWLLKPARRSLGIGIKLLDDDDDIFSYAKDYGEMKYLAQKYIGE